MDRKKILISGWILLAFIFAILGGIRYVENQEDKDVSVADNAFNCSGGCVYMGYSTDYAIGTLCRGSATGTYDSYTATCYKCVGDNNFQAQSNVNACNICYGKCIGDAGITEYSHGEQCAVTNDSFLATGIATGNGKAAILTCNHGLWQTATDARCFGQCRGDKNGSLYDQGHTCLDPRTDNYCWVCENAAISGHGQYGGMNYYDIANAKCDPVRAQTPGGGGGGGGSTAFCTPETQDTCINDIVDGGAPRNYAVGETCHTTLKVSSQFYGTYTCKDNGNGTGTFTKDNVIQKCESEGTLYDLGETITWLSTCYQCTNPGEKTSVGGVVIGGFTQVDASACPTLTGNIEEPPVGSCTNEIKTCPGGATVTRNPNRGCDFNPCPVVSGQSCSGICKGDSELTDYGVGTTCFGGTTSTSTVCYECMADGFTERAATVCQTGKGIGGGISIFDPDDDPQNTITHASVGRCLGDFNNNDVVDLQDFAQFGKLFGKVLLGEQRVFEMLQDNAEEFTINLQDFAQFALNFDKDLTNCAKRTVELNIN